MMEFNKSEHKRLSRTLKRDPADYDANLQMGLLFLKHEDVAAATPYLEKAAGKSCNANLAFVLANAYNALGRNGESAAYFEKAIVQDSSNFEYLRSYGSFLLAKDKIDEALEILNRAAELEPQNFELFNDIGVLCYRQKKYGDAQDRLKKSLEINPDYMVACINLGYVYLAMNRLSECKRIIKELDPAGAEDAEFHELKRQYKATMNQNGFAPSEQDTDLSFSDQLYQIKPLKIIKSFGAASHLHEIALSIVVPIYNEVENIRLLYNKLQRVLKTLKENYEIIFVDDGSTDGSRELLAEIADEDEHFTVIQFRRNYGQTAALNAGFKYARGSVVVTLDADLQNDPEDIPRLLEKMSEGYDLVSGWRKDRHDAFVTRKIPSFAANKLINKLIEGTGVSLHDFGCTLKAYKKGIVKNIHLYGEMHRFIPVFAAWLGVKVAEIPVNHFPRQFGTAKYNLSRVSRVIFDLLVVRFFSDYMTRPIQFFGKIAKKLAGAGFVAILLLIAANLSHLVEVSFGTIVLLTALLLFAVLQIISMGLLGEIMIRSYFETQKKDYYVVENIINGEEPV